MSTQKEARRDAREYARAQMFYGEGAGVRRKLISAKVEGRSVRDEAYARAFHQELSHQDMADHATKARRERELKDKSHSVNKNVRGLITGNKQSLSTGVMVVSTIGYFAHQTGLDKKAYSQGQKFYKKAKHRVEYYKARRKLKKSGIHLITDLNI